MSKTLEVNFKLQIAGRRREEERIEERREEKGGGGGRKGGKGEAKNERRTDMNCSSHWPKMCSG